MTISRKCTTVNLETNSEHPENLLWASVGETCATRFEDLLNVAGTHGTRYGFAPKTLWAPSKHNAAILQVAAKSPNPAIYQSKGQKLQNSLKRAKKSTFFLPHPDDSADTLQTSCGHSFRTFPDGRGGE